MEYFGIYPKFKKLILKSFNNIINTDRLIGKYDIPMPNTICYNGDSNYYNSHSKRFYHEKTVGTKFRHAVHFDFHTSPGIENILENFDAEKFADQLAAAHVEYINMAARCNMGFSCYNTKVGKKYPGLGDRDPLKEILDACHKRGIGVTAYFNIGLNHEMAADNPGWLKIRKNGVIHEENKFNNFFRIMCYNSPYREHFLEQIREVCEYDIDGIFCDCSQEPPATVPTV